jgi:hypothetical protein
LPFESTRIPSATRSMRTPPKSRLSLSPEEGVDFYRRSHTAWKRFFNFGRAEAMRELCTIIPMNRRAGVFGAAGLVLVCSGRRRIPPHSTAALQIQKAPC